MAFRIFLILSLILLLQIFLRLPFINEPLERDEGFYGYMGQRILAGEIPYRDVFDHKPPAVYYLFAAVIKTAGGTLTSIRVATLFYSMLTTLTLFAAGRLLLGTGGGLLAAFLFALFSGGPLIHGASANTETFMLLPVLLALFCFLHAKSSQNRFWFFLAGLFSGLAVMFKQVALFNFAALLVFALPFALPLLAGFAVIPLASLTYFSLNGALPDFINCVLLVNRTYLQGSPVPFFFFDPRFGLAKLWRLAAFENGALWLLSCLALILILTQDRGEKLRLLALWGLFSFAGVAAGTLFFGHYFIQIIPALALLSSCALVKIFKQGRLSEKIILTTLLILISALNLRHQLPYHTKLSPFQIAEAKYGGKEFGIAYRLSLALAKHLAKEDRLLVWSAEPEVYFYLNQKAPGRFAYYYGWMKGIFPQAQFLQEIKAESPRYLLWTNYHPPFPEFEKWAQSHYYLRQTFMGWKLLEKSS